MICEVEGCSNPVRARSFCWMHYQRLRKSGDIPISRFARPLIPKLGIKDEEWIDHAACATVGGDWWFAEKGESIVPAVNVCRECPVQAECLNFAIANREPFGVWGGMSARQRQDLRTRRPA